MHEVETTLQRFNFTEVFEIFPHCRKRRNVHIRRAQDEDEDADATLHASPHQQRHSWSLSAQTASGVASPSTQTAERQQKQRNGPLEQVATI